MICNGIDVSKWQGAVDWSAVKKRRHPPRHAAGGLRHRRHRPPVQTQRGGVPAPRRPLGGLLVQLRHHPAAARQEAARCLQLLAGLTPELPVAYDIEYEPGILALDNAGRTALVKAFLGAVEEAGYYGILYASTDFIRNRLNWRELACYDVWAAQYGSACSVRCPTASGSTAAKMPWGAGLRQFAGLQPLLQGLPRPYPGGGKKRLCGAERPRLRDPRPAPHRGAGVLGGRLDAAGRLPGPGPHRSGALPQRLGG